MILIAPPDVLIVAEELLGAVIISGLAPPELIVIVDVPFDAVIVDVEPSVKPGVEITTALPPPIVLVVAAPVTIDAVAPCALKLTVPALPAL